MANVTGYNKVKLDIHIPAFDVNQNGLIVKLKLLATPADKFRVEANGLIASALEKSFIRVIEIMSSIKNAWNCLEGYQYKIISFDKSFRVKDARSADLSLCIAALNVIRTHQKMNQISNLIGTGALRIDGSFNGTLLEEKKEKAALKSNCTQIKFINAERCNHIFDLETLLNRC